MQLSEDTLNIIKNFSNVNQSILFRPGNVIRTIEPSKSIFARATVKETFPVECAIYELRKFLGVLSLFNTPDIQFGEKQLKISEGKRTIKYTYADPAAIVAPPDKDIVLPSEDVSFSITSDDFQGIVRAANILGVKNIVVIGDGTKMSLSAMEVKNPSTDNYSIDVGDTDKTFKVVFSVDNLVKILVKDYNITVCAKGITRFESNDVTYYVAIESTSEFAS